MLSYEVTIELDDGALALELERFMSGKHLAAVFATGCFVDAHFELSDGVYRNRYTAASQEDLDRYFAEHAPRLRDEVAVHFPKGLRITRAVWRELARC